MQKRSLTYHTIISTMDGDTYLVPMEQKLLLTLLTAYRKSYIRNRLVPKWMTLTFA